MKIIPKERSLNIFAELARSLVSAKWNDPDGVARRSLPLTMEPWTSDDQVRVIEILRPGITKNLPRTPRIFLIL
jgi:hypothetical protein